MKLLTLFLYLAAALAYGACFIRRGKAVGQLATSLLAAAALAHTFVIGMTTMELGHAPFVGTGGAVSAFVWLLSLAYLYTEMTTGERAMGVFVAPLLVVLQLLPTFGTWGVARPPVLETPFFTAHVLAMLFAYAAFGLACVIGITYVLLFKEIKAKHLGFFYARLPSLQILDAMNQRAVLVGWLSLSAGLVIGAIWIGQARQYAPTDARIQAMSLFDPKIFIALLCWGLYTFQLYARRAIGWTGRRAAYLSALGFVIVLLNFLPVTYFFTRSHNFS